MVRIKLIISFLSALIVLLVVCIETNFFGTPTLKRWSSVTKLSWDDFKGVVPPFTSYGAAISSHVVMDSNDQGEIEVYAVQNDQRSWSDRSTESDEGLRHEQYHFNITEYHARKLRQQIAEYGDFPQTPPDFLKSRIDDQLDDMQDLYDFETDHSLANDYQNFWEYKIDSMLTEYDSGRGIVYDRFSGVKAWFPAQPSTYHFARDSFQVIHGYYLEAYDLRLRYLTRYDAGMDTSRAVDNFVSFLQESEFSNIQVRDTVEDGLFVIHSSCEDTTYDRLFLDRIIHRPPYTYQLTVYYPLQEGERHLYQRMANSFLRSFTLEPQDSYWIERFREQGKELDDLTRDGVDDTDDFNTLTSYRYSDYSLRYHLPIDHAGSILIPFEIVMHKPDEVEEVLVKINNHHILGQEVDSVYQIVRIDKDYLVPDSNNIQFGYTIKADSVTGYYHFHSSIVEYEYSP